MNAKHLIILANIIIVIIIGYFRPEWKSRKAIISWMWTISVIEMISTNPTFSETFSGQLFIAGALILNVINFIGDRIEAIKFKDFSASLTKEKGKK
jgi:hypothetical protein